MSTHTATREWGPADVATVSAMAALVVALGGGIGWFWATVTLDVAALAHALLAVPVILAMAADVAFMARQVRGLLALRGRS
jgi:hypothetical protein